MTILSSSRQGSGCSGQIPNLRIRWDGDAGSEITPGDGGTGWKGAKEEGKSSGIICPPPPCPLTVRPPSQCFQGHRAVGQTRGQMTPFFSHSYTDSLQAAAAAVYIWMLEQLGVKSKGAYTELQLLKY